MLDADPAEPLPLPVLFERRVAEMTHAEKTMGFLLDRMAGAASSHPLKVALITHQEESAEQLKRLTTVFSTLDHPPEVEPSPCFEKLARQAESLLSSSIRGTILDGELALAGRRFALYAIDHYDLLLKWTRQLGLRKAEDLLAESLEEEREAEARLADLDGPVATVIPPLPD